MDFDTAIQLWEEGQRRLRATDPGTQQVLERVVDRIADELRRRLGGAFTTDELAALYSAGTDWALDLAIATSPDDPRAWDAQTAADAAFVRYVREATDFAGGRRRVPDDEDERE